MSKGAVPADRQTDRTEQQQWWELTDFIMVSFTRDYLADEADLVGTRSQLWLGATTDDVCV